MLLLDNRFAIDLVNMSLPESIIRSFYKVGNKTMNIDISNRGHFKAPISQVLNIPLLYSYVNLLRLQLQTDHLPVTQDVFFTKRNHKV